MDLEKSDRDYDNTYSKKNRTNDEKLYRVYFKFLSNINIKYNPNIDEINEEGFYDAGTVEIDKNLDARIYKEHEGVGPSIGWDTDIQIIESLKQKLNITNKIIPKNWQDGYLKYDKDKQKFYQEYSVQSINDENKKTYRFYFIGTNKNYEFSDENDTKLDLTDEKNIDIVLAFIEQEYDNVKNIKLNNKNILNENNRNYLDVEVTEDNGMKRNAKIFLNPTTIKSSSDYRSIDIDVAVSTEELLNRKLKKETINRINEKINNKINNNPLYNENFILNDKNIYKYNNYQYIRVYDKNDGKYLYVKISNTKPDFEINLTEDEPDEEDLNFLKSLKISEYNCYIDEISKYYTSKQGNLSVLDFVNSKLNENEYIDNFEQKNEYTEKENLNLFIFHIKNKTNNTTRYITINLSTPNIIDSVYLDNFNVNLILTDKNKEDLKTIIKRYAKRNYKKINMKL